MKWQAVEWQMRFDRTPVSLPVEVSGEDKRQLQQDGFAQPARGFD
jgi:hypothetical protein